VTIVRAEVASYEGQLLPIPGGHSWSFSRSCRTGRRAFRWRPSSPTRCGPRRGH